MSEGNEGTIFGKSFHLNDAQKAYLKYEEMTLSSKYANFLEDAKSEAEMQYFLESNPILIPGLYDLHNGPVGNIVISKLQLSNEYVTDFAFISVNSALAQITLVEIESPIVGIFRKSDDEFTSAFNKAHQQVRDWELWTQQNAIYLKDMFRTIYHKSIFKHQKVVLRCILIAGRRSEVQENSRREKRWAGVNQTPSISIMTYDRLNEVFIFNVRLFHELLTRQQNIAH